MSVMNDVLEPDDFEATRTGALGALDTHLAYWEWADTAGRLEDVYKRMLLQSYDIESGYTRDWGAYANGERSMLNEAKTCWIDKPMVDVAMYSAGIEFTELDPDSLEGGAHEYQEHHLGANTAAEHKTMWLAEDRIPVLKKEMLPCDAGLLMLAKPFPMVDYDTRIAKEYGPDAMSYLRVKAIGWKRVPDVTTWKGQATDGVALYLYVDPRGTYFTDWVDSYVRRGWSVPPLALIDFSGWAFNTEFGVGPWETPHNPTPDSIRPHIASLRMFLASVWGLMYAYLDTQRPTRPQMKRAKRNKMPEDGDVSVIHLRKFLSRVEHKSEASDYDEDGNPRWSHRWLVRPHWAWRACSEENADEGEVGRKRVYIEAYTKGPEHLPLVIKEKVYSIDR